MTDHKNKKERIRARMAKTGESYQAAHHVISGRVADAPQITVETPVPATLPQLPSAPPSPPPASPAPPPAPAMQIAQAFRFSLHYRVPIRTSETTWGVDSEHDVDLVEGRFSVGRYSACNLVIEDLIASRKHASFVVENGRVFVEDHASANGVFVNGKRMREPSKEIWKDDAVLIGRHLFFLRKHAVPAAEGPPSPQTSA
jgi:hypothetical protein